MRNLVPHFKSPVPFATNSRTRIPVDLSQGVSNPNVMGAVLLERRYPDKQHNKMKSEEMEDRWKITAKTTEDVLPQHRNSLKKWLLG